MIEVGPLKVFLEDRTVFRARAPYPISSRAFSILEALIAARGSLVSKEQLIQHAWPDTTVEENNLHVHIVALRRALGTAREILRTVPGRGYMLLPQPEEAPRQSAVWSLGLPFVDTLFGRDDAIVELLSLLERHSIVTLAGAGGIGKTSLAVELCRDTGDLFTCIRFVSLAPVSDDRQARDAVLEIFADIAQGSAMTIDDLARGLRNARCLLILDNCEHLIVTAASIAQTMTAGNPGVRVLATSREPLRVPAEKLFPISTLTCPPEHATAEEARSTDAVKLFLHRLHRHAAHFPENEATLPVIAEICRRLDGIPLAIELAAARAVTLGLDTVRSHLDNRFALLTGGSHDVLPRHQTLKAVFEWSYRLLSDTEQLLFREAGIFADGFSLDAALSMMARHGLSASATVEGLAGLVSKSLLYVDRKNSRRYRQLESARVYARILLDTHGEIANASHAHALFYRDFFEEHQEGLKQRNLVDTHALYSGEIGNLRAALAWAFSASRSSYLGIELTAIAAPMLFDLPRLEECAHWASIALESLKAFKLDRRLPQTRLKLLSAYASALVYTEGPKACVDLAWKETMLAAKACNDAGQQLKAAWGRWNRWQYAGDAARALTGARDFANTATQIGTPQQRVLGRRLMGIALHYTGRHEEALVELQAVLSTPDMAIERWSPAGSGVDQVALTMATLARTMWFLGDTRASMALVEEAEESARVARQELSLAYVLMEATIPLTTLQVVPDALRLAIDGLRKVCRTASIPIWLVCCDAFEWVARAQETTLEQSELEQMEAAITRLRNTGYLAPYPLVLGEFAKALDASGQKTRAVAILDDAINHCSERESGWYRGQLESIQESVKRERPMGAVQKWR